MTNKENWERRFSLEQDFMNYDTDDILLGYMEYLATVNPNWINIIKNDDGSQDLFGSGRLYLTKKKFIENKKSIMRACEFNNAKTMKNHIDKLINKGLLKCGEIDLKQDGKKVECYYFPYDIDGRRYQLINFEILEILVNVFKRQAIKIYIYLLNKWLWKEREEYSFTAKEIALALGYSETTAVKADTTVMINDILQTFKAIHLIDYVDTYQTLIINGKEIPSPIKYLHFVAEKRDDTTVKRETA